MPEFLFKGVTIDDRAEYVVASSREEAYDLLTYDMEVGELDSLTCLREATPAEIETGDIPF